MQKSETALANINEATELLENANSLEEILDIRAKADAIATLARAKGADQAHQKALEIKIRAERKAGKFVQKIPDKQGTSPNAGEVTKESIKNDFGRGNVHRWEKLAEVPDDAFEEYIDKSISKTQSGLLELARMSAKKEDIVSTNTRGTRIQIFNGDVRNALIEDNSIDLILTDPLYSKESLELWASIGSLALNWLKPSGLFIGMSGTRYLDKVISNLSDSLEYRWTIALLLKQPYRLLLDKLALIEFWKPIFIFQKPPITRLPFFSDLIQGEGKAKEFHVYGQNFMEFKKLLDVFSKEGDLVLEPFAGGGSTIEACRQAKRRCLAYEIDKKAFQTLKKQFPQACQ